jgi:hypothetical protein
MESRHLLAADPVINEFLASNNEGLQDGFGVNSDWIELYNAGDQAVDLGGYHLTDDRDELNQWTFPAATILDAGEYLVVFASGRDTVDPNGGLHTNFRIARGGESLALVNPAGQIVSGYGMDAEGFPEQLIDTSYGRFVGRSHTELVSPNSLAQLHVPTGTADATSWFAEDFEGASDWPVGPAGIGFDRFAQQGVPVSGGTAVLQLDFGDSDGGEAGPDDTEEGWTNFYLTNNGTEISGVTVSVLPIGGISLQERDRTAPVDMPPSLTIDQLYDDFIFASSQTDDTGLELRLQGLVPHQEYEVTIWSYDNGSIGERVSRWQETSGSVPVEIESTYQFDGRIPPTSNLDHTMSASLTASATGELRIEGRRNGGTSFGVFLNAIQLVVPSIEAAIERDVTQVMADIGSSAYLRVPFEMPAAISPDQLTLEMQYDSGFIAYLNGTEVARRNVPDTQPLPFNTTAQTERSVVETLRTETIDLSAVAHLLVPGDDNILALHGVSSSLSDPDFLIRPRLMVAEIGQAQTRYFATPTPGAANTSQPFIGIVADTTFSIDRGFYQTPQEVAITSGTPGASIVYTLDGSVPSADNGVRVDPVSPESTPEARVTIATTSYLRAAAIKSDYLSSNVDTQTYLFLEDIITQSIDPSSNPIYPATWQSRAYRADYDMDPEVVAHWDDNRPDNDDFGIREALRSIPTMSLVMNHDDLWNESSGIYPRAQSQGTFWRRAGSVEYIDPASGETFQVNAGIQMHGGASRDNERTKKHSFRFVFSEQYDGPAELQFPLFNDSPLDSFNTLVLKSFFTDGFPTRTATGRYSPLDSQYLRDTWMRDVRLAMGGLDAASEYVHLYINGLYWGLYSPVERPDDAFLASYLGGEREDYDIVKDFNELFRGNRVERDVFHGGARRQHE